jgi:hypothetical protein
VVQTITEGLVRSGTVSMRKKSASCSWNTLGTLWGVSLALLSEVRADQLEIMRRRFDAR